MSKINQLLKNVLRHVVYSNFNFLSLYITGWVLVYSGWIFNHAMTTIHIICILLSSLSWYVFYLITKKNIENELRYKVSHKKFRKLFYSLKSKSNFFILLPGAFWILSGFWPYSELFLFRGVPIAMEFYLLSTIIGPVALISHICDIQAKIDKEKISKIKKRTIAESKALWLA